jgi:hypothetical protein
VLKEFQGSARVENEGINAQTLVITFTESSLILCVARSESNSAFESFSHRSLFSLE